MLDKCIPITPVTVPSCVETTTTVSCSGSIPLPIKPCPVTPVTPSPAKCVNDNLKRPWPSPPPIEVGCNPVSLQITNSDQNLRLEGNISYISEDACLPQLNLNLVVPPSVEAATTNLTGYGYTTYKGCSKIGPMSGAHYKTPQDFLGNEPGAAFFHPRPSGQMAYACEDDCTYKSLYGSQIAKFNMIGPILVEITGHYDLNYVNVSAEDVSERVVYAWIYSFNAANCIIAGNMCFGNYGESWQNYNMGLSGGEAVNIKENVEYSVPTLTPGVNMADMLQKGYKPQPIMNGTQVMLYGWVPWGQNNCSGNILWFFSEQNAFAGECRDTTANEANPSMMPSRRISSAGMFFGSNDDANRV